MVRVGVGVFLSCAWPDPPPPPHTHTNTHTHLSTPHPNLPTKPRCPNLPLIQSKHEVSRNFGTCFVVLASARDTLTSQCPVLCQCVQCPRFTATGSQRTKCRCERSEANALSSGSPIAQLVQWRSGPAVQVLQFSPVGERNAGRN